MIRIQLRALLCCVMVLCLSFVQAQQQSKTLVSRVQINITPANADRVGQMGLDLTHGTYIPGRYYISDLTSWQIEQVKALGFETEILIPDVTAYYQSPRAERSLPACQQYNYDYRVPKNFELGSMGGFLTYSEMLDALDLMQLEYPDIISIRDRVGDETTHQGRSLYWVRISDNANQDEAEPEILYTALHHAREPMSMMQMIYLMWYLLEGYGTDPEATYLINNNELYFIPCVNPDGYVYNQTIAPDGGGFWRKNMRDNDNDGVFDEKDDGVDLNRNYGYQWGLDDVGSSGNESSEVYRGPEAFSEPETRDIKAFIEEHNILFALNYHSYGNYFLYPWGYTEEENPDISSFINYGELMTLDNGFKAGTSQETVGYPTNGSSDDWLYASHNVFAMTPELGDDDQGFWPDASEIIPLAQASLKNNLALAHLPHQFATVADEDRGFFTSDEGVIDVHIKSYGGVFGDMALTGMSMSPELHIVGNIVEVSLGAFEEGTYQIPYSIDPGTPGGQELSFVILLDNGFFEVRDTLTKTLAGETIAFAENGDDLSDWDVSEGTWGSTNETAHSGTTCLTDSPNGDYEPNLDNIIQIKDPIDLTNALHAILEFWTKWEIEEYIDYAQVQVSIDGVNWQSLCGQYTKQGSVFQLPEPIYDAVQPDWVKEGMDLSDYVGNEIYIRFVMISDNFMNLDGIYVDDLAVRVYDSDVTATHDVSDGDVLLTTWPNPADDQLWVSLHDNSKVRDTQEIRVTDILGSTLFTQKLKSGEEAMKINTSALPAGMYLVHCFTDGHLAASQKIVIE